MQPFTCRSLTALAVAASLVVLAACSPISPANTYDPGSRTWQTDSEKAAHEFRQARADALTKYIERERSTIPEIHGMYPGLYSELSIDGSFQQQDGSKGLPAGEYAVIWFDYTYAQPQDWGTTMDWLDTQKPALDRLCSEELLPAMKRAGVIGPRGAVWSYYDERSQFGALWSHSCSEWESTAQQ